jgi:serine/threonine-protein kinase
MCPNCGKDNRDTGRFCAYCQAQLQGLLGTHVMLQNRYEIINLLGCGGMGAVYLALDHRLGQNQVAVKENLDTSQQAATQFQQEANVLAQLDHPNLPKVIDHFIESNGRQYLVMEYVAGDDLATSVKQRGALPEAQVLDWADELLDALTYLHEQPQPILHRDIKPGNIKITPKGKVKLVDFGLVKFYNQANPYTATLVHGRGSPGYAPPEQHNPAGHTDARSDIYALGATLYHLLTGEVPATATDRIANPTGFLPPRHIKAAIAPATEAVILKALELPMSHRFQTAREMRQALQGVLPPPTPRPVLHPVPRQGLPAWSLWLAGAIIAGLVIVLLLTLNKQIPTQTVVTVAATAPIVRVATSTSVKISTPVPTLTPMPTSKPADISGAAPGIGSTRVSDKDGMVMVYVPAGEFLMGSANSDRDGNSDERPQHKVYLDAYWIDRTDVTNAMFERFVAATGYKTDAENLGSGWVYVSKGKWDEVKGADWRHPRGAGSSINELNSYPVVQVSWNDAMAYCHWAGRQLPTEAQWEKAARGTDGRIYPWSNETATCDYAVMDDGQGLGCGRGNTAWPVGSKPKGASPYGALDMAGNLWEWVADWYSESYYSNSPYNNPQGPSFGRYHVLHGGSWFNTKATVRISVRDQNPSDFRYDAFGFRCALNSAP